MCCCLYKFKKYFWIEMKYMHALSGKIGLCIVSFIFCKLCITIFVFYIFQDDFYTMYFSFKHNHKIFIDAFFIYWNKWNYYFVYTFTSQQVKYLFNLFVVVFDAYTKNNLISVNICKMHHKNVLGLFECVKLDTHKSPFEKTKKQNSNCKFEAKYFDK